MTWQEPEIRKKMVVSTVHYDYRDEPRLRELIGEELESGFVVVEEDRGFEIMQFRTDIQMTIQTIHQLVQEMDLRHPHGLWLCLLLAFVERGCDSLLIDGDGPTLPQFPTYEASWGIDDATQTKGKSCGTL